MPKIKTVWGPGKTKVLPDRIRWWFSGVRDNGMKSQWILTFYFDSREFRTKHTKTEDDARLPQLPELKRIAEARDGLVTDMLRAKLKPEHIAEATRLALAWQQRKP